MHFSINIYSKTNYDLTLYHKNMSVQDKRNLFVVREIIAKGNKSRNVSSVETENGL